MTKITADEYHKDLFQYIHERVTAPGLKPELGDRKDKMNFESDIEVDYRKMLDENGIDYSDVPIMRPRVK